MTLGFFFSSNIGFSFVESNSLVLLYSFNAKGYCVQWAVALQLAATTVKPENNS